MEIVIPPRDHGPSTFKYMWDDNGEVTQISRISPGQYAESSGRGSAGRGRKGSGGSGSNDGAEAMMHSNNARGRGRQTVQWPFQSVATETTLISSPVMAHFPGLRRATWQPPGRLRDSDAVSVDRSIVPDYIVNYIRGETPETLARKKKNNGRLAERDVDIEDGGGRHMRGQSRSAALEGGFLDDDSSGRIMMNHPNNSGVSDDRRCLTGEHNGLHHHGGNNNPPPPAKGGGWRRLTNGWRWGVAVNAMLAFIILLTGFVCLIAAVARSGPFAGEAVVFSGPCDGANRVGWGLQALANVLAVALVAGANYVFQVLTSPTRAELDAAHARRRWLDIGVPSVRNCAHISSLRVLAALVLVVAALLAQVLYNALMYASRSGVGYGLLVVSPSFLGGAPFSNATANNAGGLDRLEVLALQDLAARNELANMTAPQCLARFSGGFDVDFEAVLLVTSLKSAQGGGSLIQTAVPGSPASASVNPDASSVTVTLSTTITPSSSSSSASSQILDTSTIQFCLAQRRDADSQPTCTVSLHESLLGIVAFLNLVTVVCTSVVLFNISFDPLITLGDAVASFLRNPDETTRGSCLMTKTDVWQKRWGFREAKYWVPRNNYWFQAASLPRWAFVALIWASLVGLAAAALGLSMRHPSQSLSAFGSAAAASASSSSIYTLPRSAPASAAGLIAALPQLLLGVLYLATNSLLTTFFLSHESSLYALGKPLPLRVSADPVGEQATSLYLTLPRPASWLLAALFAGMGFVASQGVFVVAARLDPAGAAGGSAPTTTPPQLTALGFSSTALLALLALLVVLATATLGLGLRRAPAAVMVNGQAVGNPLVLEAGSCSAVVSARCHPLLGAGAGEEGPAGDAHARRLCWGVVDRRRGSVSMAGMVVSHCGYSASGVTQLEMSRSYA